MLHSDFEKILYKILSLRDEANIQNDLMNTNNVDVALTKMEALILDSLDELKEAMYRG